MSRLVAVFSVALASGYPVHGQDADITLRRGFRELVLGLPFGSVQAALAADSAFEYRGEADVSLRLSDGESVIDTMGRVYVDRGIFQFHSGRLYSLRIYLDRSQLDYFQVYEQLRGRYGEPADLDPSRAYWQDEQTRIELERPLTVSYLDRAVFNERRQSGSLAEANRAVARDLFLEEF